MLRTCAGYRTRIRDIEVAIEDSFSFKSGYIVLQTVEYAVQTGEVLVYIRQFCDKIIVVFEAVEYGFGTLSVSA